MHPRFLLIDSANRISGSTGEFYINIFRTYNYNKAIKLVSAQMATTYNVTVSNNIISWNSSVNGANSRPITPGIYTIDTFANAVQTAMNYTETVGHSVTIDPTSGKMTITPNNGTIAMQFAGIDNGANDLMGFGAVNGQQAATAVGTNLVDLSYPRYVYITMSGLVANVESTEPDGQGTFVLFLNQNSGTITQFSSEQYQIKADGNFNGTIYISLRDPEGKIYEPGVNWCMMLEITGS